MSYTNPRKPTREQERAETALRKMGVTVRMGEHAGHNHPEPLPGCITCALRESAKRVNGGE